LKFIIQQKQMEEKLKFPPFFNFLLHYVPF
jgi:hypothetical protein